MQGRFSSFLHHICIIFSNILLRTHSKASEKHMRIAEKNIKNNRHAICELQHRDMRRDNMRFACFLGFNKHFDSYDAPYYAAIGVCEM